MVLIVFVIAGVFLIGMFLWRQPVRLTLNHASYTGIYCNYHVPAHRNYVYEAISEDERREVTVFLNSLEFHRIRSGSIGARTPYLVVALYKRDNTRDVI
jgi:hypothetical protein